jgi:hypothetical protein
VPDLQILQVCEPLIGGGNVPQMLISIDEHQTGSVDAEDRMSGMHDLPDRLLEVHLAEAQPAKLH